MPNVGITASVFGETFTPEPLRSPRVLEISPRVLEISFDGAPVRSRAYSIERTMNVELYSSGPNLLFVINDGSDEGAAASASSDFVRCASTS